VLFAAWTVLKPDIKLIGPDIASVIDTQPGLSGSPPAPRRKTCSRRLRRMRSYFSGISGSKLPWQRAI